MRVLVCGAGVAGLSAGINLGNTGHDVTIVERAQHLRVNGSPIDIRGESLDVARQMGILDEIRARRVDMTERGCFVDENGDRVAELPFAEINDTPDDTEIPREDLAQVLRNALGPSVTLTFDEAIAELHDDGHGVDVLFTSGARARYDLVVGADGLHSATRRLVFGPEHQYLRHLGYYTAVAHLPNYHMTGVPNPIYNFPGHLSGIFTYRDVALAVLNFRSSWIDYDYHDLDAQKRILIAEFAGHDKWRVPELLDAACRDPELYFDSVSQIDMPSWHRGRVVLVGDAAHCASPMSGRGTSLALTGTWLLAKALNEHADDLDAAFAEYERDQRPHVTYAQGTARAGGDWMIPATQEAIDARNRELARAS
ncbi:monooxygenase [Mycobacterium intermedium]|uniref:Monooxygenase n=1 Tax=Mycobacterium intermedium TaxID=28445 RepID=A0A1E3S471_MYCIE|nr:FAD-dependent monooxygenase [Mycobacterium intermedium]MCV6965101.1 FAD-dependent monooxygenase [Mycobacterium intermedium]ODQ96851.1 monooxygenase [Mycobacterium intermedium]OPE45889.1 monooxygenase [Mycobacterium intermedium]ORA93677.1 monooxygenase [Mycobacterium intermedium]